MPNTPRMGWVFPSENQTPYFDAIEDFYGQQDAAAYAAREDRHIIIRGGGTISFSVSTGVLGWSADIEVLAAITGFTWRVIGPSSIQLLDGEIAYIELIRGPSSNIVVEIKKAMQVPNTDLAHIIAVRRGARVYFFNGNSVLSGAPIFDIGSGSAGAGSSLEIFDEGGSLTAGATSIDFVGPGVSASVFGTAVTVTVPGTPVEVLDEGVSQTSAVESIDFVGPGVTASAVGNDVTVVVASSGGSFTGATNETTAALTTEIVIGGLVFDGSLLTGGLAATFRLLGEYVATGGAGNARIRLYDLGPVAGPPVAGILRSTATIPFAEAGGLRAKDVGLTPSGAPGVGTDEIFNTARIYEIRMFLDSAVGGDSMQVHWAGIVVG